MLTVDLDGAFGTAERIARNALVRACKSKTRKAIYQRWLSAILASIGAKFRSTMCVS